MKNVRFMIFAAVAAFCLFSSAPKADAAMVDKVIVVVNDEVVTQREFDRMFDPVVQSYKAHFTGEELEKRIETARKGLLDQLINSKIAISLAKKEKIKIEEKDIEARINKIKTYYGSDEAFLAALDEKGTNLTEFKKEMEDQMMAQKIVEKEVASKIVVTPVQIQELYDKNKDQLKAPLKAHVREIMVRKEEGSDNTAARQKIEAIQTELSSGKDFIELAKTKSEGPYAQNGGDMGYLVKGQLMDEIDKAIFSTPKGNTTGIVETKIGYHIFRIEDVQEPRDLQLAEVTDFLKDQLFMKRFEEDLIKWLEEKRKDAYIAYK